MKVLNYFNRLVKKLDVIHQMLVHGLRYINFGKILHFPRTNYILYNFVGSCWYTLMFTIVLLIWKRKAKIVSYFEKEKSLRCYIFLQAQICSKYFQIQNNILKI